jgi:phosphoribosylglycinamide formyltransferase-1
MKFGLVCSSGGSVFATAVELLRHSGYKPRAFVVTDRSCGAEGKCEVLGIPWRRIGEPGREEFSRKAAAWLYGENSVDWTCLLFSRLVSSELFSRGPCVNIHPSLLPAFPGFGALSNALKSRSRFLGATAHVVDESIDAGTILGQVTAPVPPGSSLEELERISFAQKLYLFLSLWETAEKGRLERLMEGGETPHNIRILPWANPALDDPRIAAAFDGFLDKEGIAWVR